MTTRTSSAEWKGSLKNGSGTMKLASGAYEGAFTYDSRFQEGKGTNPEELIGAAHAGCFSMFLSSLLTDAGHVPTRIATTATVHLTAGPTISLIELKTEAQVPGISEEEFQKKALEAKQKCPVSKVLAATEIKMSARLIQ